MAIVEPDPVVESHDGVRRKVLLSKNTLAAVFQLKNLRFN